MQVSDCTPPNQTSQPQGALSALFNSQHKKAESALEFLGERKGWVKAPWPGWGLSKRLVLGANGGGSKGKVAHTVLPSFCIVQGEGRSFLELVPC